MLIYALLEKWVCTFRNRVMKNSSGILLSIFLLFFNTFFLYAQSESEIESSDNQNVSGPVIYGEGKKVVQISENAAGTLLAISDEGSVTVYDTSDYSPVCVLNDGKASKTSFYTEDENEYFVSITSDGQFQIRKLGYNEDFWEDLLDEPYFAADCADENNRKNITAVAFSRNADYVAAAYKDNTIQVHFRLRVTQGSISRLIMEHHSQVYGLEFSPSGEYLASVSSDGNAYIWNSYNSTKVTQFSGVYTRSKVPVYFTEDSNYIVFQDGRNTFRIADFSGNTLYSIMTGRPVKAIKPLKDPDLIAICNDKNEIMVYSISSRRQISIVKVPQIESNQRSVDFTSFEFDLKADLMYAGYADGQVYVYEPEPYLDDTEMLITDASLAGKGSGNFVHQRFSSVSASAGANYLTKPYLVSGNFRVEYLYSEIISPFYAGGGLSLSLGYPRKEFPAHYKIRGESVASPKLMSATLYVPAGYSFSPWNNDIRILSSLKTGVKMTSLALITNEGSIVGEPNYSFFISLGAGMQIKWFAFDANIEYDTIGKVSPSLYAGYVFRWGEK